MRVFLAGLAAFLLVGATVPWWGAGVRPPTGAPVVAVQPHRALDPLLASTLDDLRLLEALCEPLTRIEVPALTVGPALATSWEVSADGLTWTFHLRPEARWSDGSVVTAAQAAAGLERHRRLGSAVSSALAAIAPGTEAIQALDPHTLALRLSRPEPALPAILALAPFAPEHHSQLGGDAGAWADPLRVIGNGPLRCVGYQPRHHLDLAPSPTYGGPHTARGPVRLQLVSDGATAVRLYLDRSLDALLRLTPDTVQDLRKAGQPGLATTPGWGVELYRLRAVAMPTAATTPTATADERPAGLLDPRLRRALARSVDRESICRDLLGGSVQPCSTLVPAGPAAALGYRPPTEVLAFDPAAAKRELAAAAAEGPLPTLELLLAAGSPERRRTAEHLADRWRRDLGIEIEVRTLPDAGFAQRVKAKDYDLARGAIIGDYLDPAYFLRCFRTGDGMNRTGFGSPAFEAALQRAESAVADHNVRLEEAERILLEQVPAIPLYNVSCTFLVRPGISGIEANALELVHLDQVGR